jgi:hypothetical protein
VSSIGFTLVFGVLAGIAGFGGSAAFESVLVLGVLGLMHMTVAAGRRTRERALERARRTD